jgi:hypothetical protein
VLALALLLVGNDAVVEKAKPDASTIALSTAGAAAGGALVPVTLMGGVYGATFLLTAAARAIPPPPPNDFSRNEGYGICVVTPLTICIAGPAEVCGAGAGVALSSVLAYLGALSLGDDDAKLAAARAAGGSCAGCGFGFVSLCAYAAIAQSTTANGVTTIAWPPPQPASLVLLMSTSALGAAAATSIPMVY